MSANGNAGIQPATHAAEPAHEPPVSPAPAADAAPAVRLATATRRPLPDAVRLADADEAVAVATALRRLMHDGHAHAARAQANVPPRNALALLG